MAPSKQAMPPFSKDERVLCFHHEMLYEAKILDIQPAEGSDGQWSYKIHYKGWKSSWDDWVSQDRIRKFTDENKELASQLQQQFKQLQSGKTAAKQGVKKGAAGGGRSGANGSDIGSARGSEERAAGATTTATGRGPRRARDYDLEHEDAFHARPSIKIAFPDHLKSMMVDDWENVTRNCQLVPIPHPHPVDQILDDYLDYERRARQPGTAHADSLEEVIAGLRDMFNLALGRILLYRFERPQYQDIYKLWKQPDADHKNACDTYGAEHLCRLISKLPEILGQSNMDQQSLNRVKDEMNRLTGWLGQQYVQYFVSEYDTPGQAYKESLR